MNRLFLHLLFGLFPFIVVAQQGSGSCFSRTEFAPAFIALYSEPDSDLVSWYTNLFGMEVIKTFTSTDGSHTGTILQKDQVFIEILEQERISDQLEEGKKGIKKFGLFINSPVQEIKACLRQEGFGPGRIFQDVEMDFFLLHIRDPEGNELELISKN